MKMDEDPLHDLLAERIDWRFKGFPASNLELTIGTVRDAGWNVLDGDLPLPLMVLKKSALDHNLELMASWASEHEVSLAPHAKTTMSPQLIRRQLDAGAWAITVATISQARLMRAFGVKRILLANQVVDEGSLRWLARDVVANPSSDVYTLVDSAAGVALLSAALDGLGRPAPVLVELGLSGRRTGCRSVQEAIAVADAVGRSPCLTLAGVEGFEGVIDAGNLDSTLRAVDAFLRDLVRLTEELERAGAFNGQEEVIVSAGGSAFFDRVVDVALPPLRSALQERLRLVLRSGCYLAHDAAYYEGRSPLASVRGPADETLRLRGAIELWGAVLSRPEPDLVIVGIGRRDVGSDQGLPIPTLVHDVNVRYVAGSMQVLELNDQHALVRVPGSDPVAVGEMLACGISHPCTTFDKWPLIPIVDDSYAVVDAVRTYF